MPDWIAIIELFLGQALVLVLTSEADKNINHLRPITTDTLQSVELPYRVSLGD